MIPRQELLSGARRLTSRANPRIREWASLGDRRAREELGLTLAEGARLSEEALAAPPEGRFHPRALLVSDSGADRPEAAGLFAKAGRLSLERYSLSDDCYARISGLRSADGLAVALSFAAETPGSPWLCPDGRWLAADRVQDPANAGALVRTALAAGFSGCLFLGGADPTSPKFLRGGMGAAFRLPCVSLDPEVFLTSWKTAPPGARLAQAVSAPGADDYRDFDYRPPLLLLLGGERGIDPRLAELASGSVHIPLAAGVESLNLAVAAGIILFEANRGPGRRSGEPWRQGK